VWIKRRRYRAIERERGGDRERERMETGTSACVEELSAVIASLPAGDVRTALKEKLENLTGKEEGKSSRKER
jgi:hypothetical protein